MHNTFMRPALDQTSSPVVYNCCFDTQFLPCTPGNAIQLLPKRNNAVTILRNFIIATMCATALQGCGSHAEEKDKKDPALATAVTGTDAFLATKGKLSSTLNMPGELVAFQQVDLYAKVNSFVKRLHVDVGSEVAAGQVLATMEAPEINSQLSAAQSKLQSLEAIHIASKANYNRLLETSKTPGTISPNDLDLAFARERSDFAQLQAAKAGYTEVTNNRDYLTIRAPFGGVITARNVSAGAYVGPSGKGSELPIFTLQEQKKLRLAVSVPEAYSSFLNNKSEVEFTVKSLPGKTFKAFVKRLAGALDYKLRSQRIEMDVINNDKSLLPGMVAEVSIPLPAKDSSFIVAKTAVVSSAEGVYVVKVNNGKVTKVPVQKGREEDGKAEVYGKLSEGDTLLKVASEEMKEGDAIKGITIK